MRIKGLSLSPLVQTLNSAALLAAWEEGVLQASPERALTLLATAWPERSSAEWADASIGERDERLLLLREELFGPQLEAAADCPRCSEQLVLKFKTRDIRSQARPGSKAELRVEASGYNVSFRLPTSADLLQLAASPEIDASRALLKRCVTAALREGSRLDAEMLPEDVITVITETMSQADPQADVRINMNCPGCSQGWSMPFDVLSYLWGEIEDWAQRLLLEVHLLASAYGWSEGDIIAMSPNRRRIYLDLVGA